jgi:hypothetical protein
MRTTQKTNPLLAIAAALTVASGLMTAAGPAAAGDGLNRTVAVVNTGTVSVWSIHMSHVDTPGWGRDLLGNDLLWPSEYGYFAPARPQGYCQFDVRIEFDDGFVQVLPWVNLCEATAIEVNNWGYTEVSY